MARRGKTGRKTLRRRAKRSSRRLSGTPAEHAHEVQTYYAYFKDAEKSALKAAKTKNCSLGLNQLEQMAEMRGRVIANLMDADESKVRGMDKIHDHVTSDPKGVAAAFFSACVAKKGTGFSGLGRTRKSRRSRR